MSDLRSGDDWNIYQQAFRENVHHLLAWGYGDCRSRTGPNDEEEVITAYIAEAVDDRINDPRTPETYTRYSVHNVHFVSPGGQTGKRLLRLDLMLEQCGIRPKRHFVFEAKRLKTGSHPIGEYTGPNGLGRFVAGFYATNDPEAAMVGYMQNRDASYWFSELERVFSNDESRGDGTLRIVERLRRSTVVRELGDEWTSQHLRLNRSSIRVFHILLDCS